MGRQEAVRVLLPFWAMSSQRVLLDVSTSCDDLANVRNALGEEKSTLLRVDDLKWNC